MQNRSRTSRLASPLRHKENLESNEIKMKELLERALAAMVAAIKFITSQIFLYEKRTFTVWPLMAGNMFRAKWRLT